MRIWIFYTLISLCACRATKKISVDDNFQLTFLDAYIIQDSLVLENTVIGGLSGIDYDQHKKLWYIISDDHKINPPRFYTATINIYNKKIDTVIFQSVQFFKDPRGEKFERGHLYPDGESIRYYPGAKQIVWCSEGRRVNNQVSDPFILIMDEKGNYSDSFSLPDNLRMNINGRGPRNNESFEGLDFDEKYKSLFLSLEGPLLQDGPRAGTGDSSAWVRIIHYNLKTRKPVGQYGYKVEPVKHAPMPAGAFKVNGVSEILHIGRDRLLVAERSFSTGHKNNTIRIFLADLKEASDISGYEDIPRLPFHPIRKKLLLDMDSLGFHVDNIEGISLGPRLANGNLSLVMVSDNNFASYQQSQVLLFEITGTAHF